MKKSIYTTPLCALFIALSFSACKNRSVQKESSAHVHADGSMHEGSEHNHDEVPVATQESFKVDSQSREKASDPQERHNHDHNPAHEHDKSHNH